MVVTKQWMEEWFAVFNRDCFSSSLPQPQFRVSHARTRLGQMSCKRRPGLLRTTLTDVTIAVSDYYDMTDMQAKSVLLHEMIHYYIAFNNIRDTSPHGAVFRRMADDLNRRYGWQIHVRENTQGWKPRADAPVRRQRRSSEAFLVLALSTTEGLHFLSRVNPRYAQALERRIRQTAIIRSHGWYLSSDQFFASFPEVRSLRGRRVTAEELEQRCATMTPMFDP